MNMLPTGKLKNTLRPYYYAGLRFCRATVRMIASAMRAVFGVRGFLRLCHFIREQIDTTIVVDGIKFDGTHWWPYERAIQLLSKEPATIWWITHYVSPGDVFYDIGANIGVFSLFAAAKRDATVLAFEPMCTNYDILNTNIHLNKLDDKITAYNIAIHDRLLVSHLNVSKFMPGKAGHAFARQVAGSILEKFEPEFRQGMVGYSIDDLVEILNLPFPNHIKVDVDGNEPLIVDGMKKTLADPRLKSLALELLPEDRQADKEVIDTVLGFGFRSLHDKNHFQDEIPPSPYMCFFVRI